MTLSRARPQGGNTRYQPSVSQQWKSTSTWNYHKCGWWPHSRDMTSLQRHPLLHSVLRPEELILLSVPCGDASFMDAKSQRLLVKEEHLQKELGKLELTDTYTAIILLRFL